MQTETLTIPVMEEATSQRDTDTVSLRADMTAVVVSEDGEVLSVSDAPPDTADAQEIVDWIGPRRLRTKARIEGLEAEKAAMIRQVSEQYDALIKRERSYLAWVDSRYAVRLRQILDRLIEGKKARSARVGLLNLRLRKTLVRTVIADPARALNWLKLAGEMKAVRVTETILKSEISEHVKGAMVSEGILTYEGGEDEFSLE